ncbi:MAG: signal peptidase II [Holosporales bacterium]|jgi:signal peptidase II|nr:signal peptidase II [Holosporales bacterium]
MTKANLKNVHFFSICLGIFVIIFDQATKWSVLAFMEKGEKISVLPFVNLVLTFNYGTSFGLLTPYTGMQRYMITFVTILCIIFLIYVFFKLKTSTEKILCSFLIGGAIGNLLDRFSHGAVIDFLDFYYNNWHWPAFNVADAFISSSAFLLIIFNLSR